VSLSKHCRNSFVSVRAPDNSPNGLLFDPHDFHYCCWPDNVIIFRRIAGKMGTSSIVPLSCYSSNVIIIGRKNIINRYLSSHVWKVKSGISVGHSQTANISDMFDTATAASPVTHISISIRFNHYQSCVINNIQGNRSQQTHLEPLFSWYIQQTNLEPQRLALYLFFIFCSKWIHLHHYFL
jgi:hypothetical protein